MEATTKQFRLSLESLKKEIESYKDESDIWLVRGSIKNSAGTLAIHLCGNLRHNIGEVIGQKGYIRNRDAEFAVRNLSREEIISNIDHTTGMILPVLQNLDDSELTKPWPNDTYGPGETIGSVLIRVAIHFGYHLGQINYHRRLIEN
jgi:hypothetical protein